MTPINKHPVVAWFGLRQFGIWRRRVVGLNIEDWAYVYAEGNAQGRARQRDSSITGSLRKPRCISRQIETRNAEKRALDRRLATSRTRTSRRQSGPEMAADTTGSRLNVGCGRVGAYQLGLRERRAGLEP